jgi:hypothetical protein
MIPIRRKPMFERHGAAALPQIEEEAPLVAQAIRSHVLHGSAR